MSYARFSNADVYVFAGRLAEDEPGGWTCMACRLIETPGDWWNDFFVHSRVEMVTHLRQHDKAGHNTGGAIPRLEREIELEKAGSR